MRLHTSYIRVKTAVRNKDKSNLSRLFSEVEGVTIEQYFILLKIEKIKEWLAYDEQQTEL